MHTEKFRLLDLFSGAGGAATGYHRAGFDVVGVDIKPQKRFPFQFIQSDALEFLQTADLSSFSAISASPPCQHYTLARNNGQVRESPDLVAATRQRLRAIGLPYIIENVAGAPLEWPVMLCGAAFGLGVAGLDLARHRYFESNVMLFGRACAHRRGATMGVYGNGTNRYHLDILGRGLSADECGYALGIDWMTRQELNQAIPPAFTEYLGVQLMTAVINNKPSKIFATFPVPLPCPRSTVLSDSIRGGRDWWG